MEDSRATGDVVRIINELFKGDHPRAGVGLGHVRQPLFRPVIGGIADHIKTNVVFIGKCLGVILRIIKFAWKIGCPVREYENHGFAGQTFYFRLNITQRLGQKRLILRWIQSFVWRLEDCGVRFLLTGSVRKGLKTFKVTIRLLDTSTAEDIRVFAQQLWKAFYLDFLRIKLLKYCR